MTNLDRNMRLTEHFRIGEFLVSADHPDLAERLRPGPVHVQCIYLLCATVLEPVRQRFDEPLIVLSGYRDLELNRAVGGDRLSLHMYGKAADITTPKLKRLKVFYDAIREALPFAYSQLIYYRNRGFIHVALPHPGAAKTAKIKE